MNYQDIYNKLIHNAKYSDTVERTENHHIKPRSFGGLDLPYNRVMLSLREHYIAHLLLYRIHKGTPNGEKMYHALRIMGAFKAHNSREVANNILLIRYKPRKKKVKVIKPEPIPEPIIQPEETQGLSLQQKQFVQNTLNTINKDSIQVIQSIEQHALIL